MAYFASPTYAMYVACETEKTLGEVLGQLVYADVCEYRVLVCAGGGRSLC